MIRRCCHRRNSLSFSGQYKTSVEILKKVSGCCHTFDHFSVRYLNAFLWNFQPFQYTRGQHCNRFYTKTAIWQFHSGQIHNVRRYWCCVTIQNAMQTNFTCYSQEWVWRHFCWDSWSVPRSGKTNYHCVNCSIRKQRLGFRCWTTCECPYLFNSIETWIESEGFVFFFSSQRLNVIITRAKCLLIVVGDPWTLSANSDWKQLISYCIQNKALVDK